MMTQKDLCLEVIRMHSTKSLTPTDVHRMIGDPVVSERTVARRLRELAECGAIRKVPVKANNGRDLAAYTLVGVVERKAVDGLIQVSKPCAVCGSYYRRGKDCNICKK